MRRQDGAGRPSGPPAGTSRRWRLLPHSVVRMAGFAFDRLDVLQDAAVTSAALAALEARRVRQDAARGRRAGEPGALSGEQAARLVTEAERVYEHAHARSCAATGSRLHRDFADDPLLRATVMLSNEDLWARLRPWLDRTPPDVLTRRDRRHVDTLALYLQRCCAKNDTASHHGPFAPGSVHRGATELRLSGERHRLPLLSRRATYEICETLRDDATLRPHLPVRVSPAVVRPSDLPPGDDSVRTWMVELDHTRRASRLHDVATITPLHLTGGQHALLVDLLQRARDAREVTVRDVERMARRRGVSGSDLDDLYRDRALEVGPHVPYGEPDPLPHLLAAVPPDHAASSLLRQCATAVRAFGARPAPDDDAALTAVNDAVRSIVRHVRRPARTATFYSDRSFVHEECVGPLEELRTGARAHALLEDALQPVLELFMARAHLAHQAQVAAFAAWFDHTFASSSVSVETYVRALLDDAAGLKSIAHEVSSSALRSDERLRAALDLDPLAARQVLDPGVIHRFLDEASAGTAAHGPAICNPDVMIHARSAGDLDAGRFRLVVGDLHADEDNLTHGLFGPFLASHAPELPDTVLAAYRQLVGPSERLVDVCLAHRNKTFLRQPLDLVDLELQDPSPRPSTRLRLDELLVVRTPRGLALRERERPEDLRLVTLPLAWSGVEINPFAVFGFPQRDGAPLLPLGTERHLPRLELGPAVVQRETWAVDPRTVAPGSPTTQFLAVQELRRDRGMPAHVYVKSADEPKPVFVDLDSPLLVKAFAALCRDTSEDVVVQEMFPSRAGLWVDWGDGPVTSELRCTAVTGRALDPDRGEEAS